MRATSVGVPEDPSQHFIVMRALGERRAIQRGGGGTQAYINPLPPGCNHHRSTQHALSTRIEHIFLKAQAPAFFTRALGE
jgi:hypothetical protein